MNPASGRRQKLSIPRRMVCDLLHAARNNPIISFERRMNLAELVEARKQTLQPPPWVVLFLKAYSIIAMRYPPLRQTYLSVPWPQLWQADYSIASIAIERIYHGEPAVFFGFVKSPEEQPLSELTALIDEWRTKPVEEISAFRRQIRYASYPTLLRRLLWKYATVWSGRIKAKNFGTYGVSFTGAGGATALNLIGPLTTAINTGVFNDDGTIDVRLHFDHRVMDGMGVARALAELEEILRTTVLAELRSTGARHEMARLPGPLMTR